MTIFDASSLFNLQHGGVVPAVLTLSGLRMAFGPQVRKECRSIAAALDKLIATGSADLLTDDDVPFGRFEQLATSYQLGPGETECLVLAESLGCSVCCDDLRARNMIGKEIGAGRLIGTIGLLQAAVAQGLLTEAEVRSAHSTMIRRGAFLPSLSLPVRAAGETARQR